MADHLRRCGDLERSLLSGALTTNFDFTNNPEAKQAKTIIDNAFPGAKAISETSGCHDRR